jgi:hypothetical protein
MSIVDLNVPEGWVRMFHPDLPNDKGEFPTSVVTVEAFEDNHSEKGWELVDESLQLRTDIEHNVTYVVGTAKPKPRPAGGTSGGGDG